MNNATGKRYTATSDAEGRFVLDQLTPGDYEARVEAQGMPPQMTPQVHVDVGGFADLQFRLKVAGSQESLTVSGAAALVETKPSAVSMPLDERSMSDFPLNGRRFSDLALFSPGVTQDPRSLTSATNGDLSFGGIRGFQNTFLVDGGDYNDAFFAQARGRYREPYQFSTEVVSCRSSGFRQMPTERSRDAQAAQSSMSLQNPVRITCTEQPSTTFATIRSVRDAFSGL